MALKAIKPEVIEEGKPQFMISGRSGVGKTIFALSFPNPYYIDTEGGAVRKQYREKLAASGGAYFGREQGSQDFGSVIDEIKALATTKHNYKTLVIDSFSALYNMAAAIAEEKLGNEFGRDKKEANRPTRQLMRWLKELDMTVILVCHSKEKWTRKGKEIVNEGTFFDGFEKLEYDLDLWIEVQKIGLTRSFVIRKSRIESLPELKEFPLDYSVFAEAYGKAVIEKAAVPVVMATKEQVAELTDLLAVVKIDDAVLKKWLDHAKVENWDEMRADQISACIAYCDKKLKELQKAKVA